MVGFGAGVDEADHFHRRHGLVDEFGEFDFAFGGRAEAGAGFEHISNSFDDGFWPGGRAEGDPGADVSQCRRCRRVAVDVIDAGAVAAFYEEGCAADASEGADGGVDAAGNDFLGSGEGGSGTVGFHGESERVTE